MLRAVCEPAQKTFSTNQGRARWRVRDDEKKAAPAITTWRAPVPLRAAARTLLALALDLDLDAADDQHKRSAREAAQRRARRGWADFLDGVDEPLAGLGRSVRALQARFHST